MYVDELFQFIANNEDYTLTCYLFNTPQAIIHKANAYSHRIYLNGVLPYAQIPETIKEYHYGVILYRGTTDNYIYNAPNKLFEYLACGLDVLYPTCMIGIAPYTDDIAPCRVLPFDFIHRPQEANQPASLEKQKRYTSEAVYNHYIANYL